MAPSWSASSCSTARATASSTAPPLNGSTFGTPTKVDPYHDPVWDGVDTNDGTTFDGASPTLYGQMPNVTGMFYQAGRLYFTLNG